MQLNRLSAAERSMPENREPSAAVQAPRRGSSIIRASSAPQGSGTGSGSLALLLYKEYNYTPAFIIMAIIRLGRKC